MVVATEEMNRVSLSQCVNVLQKSPVEPEAQLQVTLEFGIHEALLEAKTNMETNIDREDFDDIIARFKRKNKATNYFLTQAGPKCQTSVYNSCKRLIGDEDFPQIFSETLLKQLLEKKGSRENLNKHRSIHVKDWKPRLTETLITHMMKEYTLKVGDQYKLPWLIQNMFFLLLMIL